MLDNEQPIKCPRCDIVNTVKEWDTLSYSKCINRDMKRAYRHLNNEKVFASNSEYFYMCPSCKQWSRGSQLFIESDDPKLVKLGREPFIMFMD